LRLLSNGKLLAEFKVPNPAPGPHPAWVAQPLPVHATEGELDVILANFRACETSPQTSAEKRVYSRTECVFNVRESNRETLAWKPVMFELFDATGNHWRARPDARFEGVDQGNMRTAFLGALWPGESAWKLRVEFKRVADFPKNDLLQISKIRIPAGNELYEPHSQYEWNGASLELAAVIGKDVEWERVVRLNPDRKRACITLVLAGEILSRNWQLACVAVTDERGNRVELAGVRDPGVPGSPVPFSFSFAPREGATELNLVLAVSESRVFDFLAKPEHMKE